jgi:hypothetical protein
VVWDLRAGEDAPAPSTEGAEVLPGSYEVTVTVGDASSSGTLEVLPDPRRATGRAARTAMLEALAVMRGYTDVLDQARERVARRISELDRLVQELPAEAGAPLERGRAARDTLAAVRERFFTGPECQGICGGEPLARTVSAPLFRLGSNAGAPTALEREAMARARAALETIVTEVNRLDRVLVGPLRDALEAAGVSFLPEEEPIRMPGGA